MSYSPPGSFHVPWYADIIHAYSNEGVGTMLKGLGLLSGVTSQAWTVANTAILVPFAMDRPGTVLGMTYHAGSTGGDNFDVGIYTESGTLLVSKGTGLSAGANQQAVDITDTPLGVGRYFMAMVRDGTSAANCAGPVPAAGLCAAAGICQIASNYPLATGTPVVTTQALVPNVGVMWRTTAL